MQAPPQLDAIRQLADLDPGHMAQALLLPATWHETADGTIHGKPQHTGPTHTRTGTLGQALNQRRCPSKGCATAAKLGGPAAVTHAERAQALLAGLPSDTRLDDLLASDPGKALIRAHQFQQNTRTAQGERSSLRHGIQRIADQAKNALNTREQQHLIRASAAREYLVNTPGTPLSDLAEASRDAWPNSGWTLLGIIRSCDGTQKWADHVRHALDTDQSSGHYNRASLHPLDTPGLRAALAAGTPLEQALSHERRTYLEQLINATLTWWEPAVAALAHEPQRELLVASTHLIDMFDSRYEVYRPRYDTLLLTVPTCVARHVMTSGHATLTGRTHRNPLHSTPLDDDLTDSEHDILNTLVNDAHAGGEPIDLPELLRLARQLAR